MSERLPLRREDASNPLDEAKQSIDQSESCLRLIETMF